MRVSCLYMCAWLPATQKGFAFGASRDDIPHTTNEMLAQLPDVLTKIHSKKLSLPPCLLSRHGCSAGWAHSRGLELRIAPSSPLGTAHPAAAPRAVPCVWPEDARGASRHLPDTEISALCLERWTAQPERQKSVCWDSCSVKKHENLRITDRNKEQRH